MESFWGSQGDVPDFFSYFFSYISFLYIQYCCSQRCINNGENDLRIIAQTWPNLQWYATTLMLYYNNLYSSSPRQKKDLFSVTLSTLMHSLWLLYYNLILPYVINYELNLKFYHCKIFPNLTTRGQKMNFKNQNWLL